MAEQNPTPDVQTGDVDGDVNVNPEPATPEAPAPAEDTPAEGGDEAGGE